MKWAKLSCSSDDPIPGDLVHVTPRGDMAGYVMCGAMYIGGHQVPASEDMSKRGEPPTVVHKVLFNGNLVVISSHSHVIQVIIKDTI